MRKTRSLIGSGIAAAALVAGAGAVSVPSATASPAYHWYTAMSRGAHSSCRPALSKITNGHHRDVRWTGRSMHRAGSPQWCFVSYRATTNFAGGYQISGQPDLYNRFPQRIDYVR